MKRHVAAPEVATSDEAIVVDLEIRDISQIRIKAWTDGIPKSASPPGDERPFETIKNMNHIRDKGAIMDDEIGDEVNAL